MVCRHAARLRRVALSGTRFCAARDLLCCAPLARTFLFRLLQLARAVTDAILPLCPLVHIQANEELTKQKDQELALKDATVLAHVGVC